MADLKAVSQQLTKVLGERATTLERFVYAAKIIAAFGSGGIVLATFENWPVAGDVLGIVTLVASLFLVFSEKQSSSALADARIAMDKALEQETESETFRRKAEAVEKLYAGELDRLSHFQAARDLARAIFEEIALSDTTTWEEVSVIDLLLKQARRSLFLALGFEMTDFHTLCIYQRERTDSGGAELICRTHLRAIDCDLKQARRWKEGIGAAGIALARGEEVIVPDLLAPELGTLYSIPNRKADDAERYRSIVAEPITLGSRSDIWGVLIASSSVPGHFDMDDRSYVDVAQSLAGMISLAVKLVRSKSGAAAPPASQPKELAGG